MWGMRRDVAPILAPPPLLFFLYLGAAWGADALRPWHLDGVPVRFRFAACAGLSGGALCLGAWAFLTMRRAGTPVEPWEPTVRLVKGGPFRLTRNPLYIALTAMLLVMAVAVNSLWFYAAVPVLFATLHFGVVLREEKYLTQKFGRAYEDYRARVRRWV